MICAALVAPTVEDVRGTTVRVLQSIEFDEYVMPDKIEIQIQEVRIIIKYAEHIIVFVFIKYHLF